MVTEAKKSAGIDPSVPLETLVSEELRTCTYTVLAAFMIEAFVTTECPFLITLCAYAQGVK